MATKKNAANKKAVPVLEPERELLLAGRKVSVNGKEGEWIIVEVNSNNYVVFLDHYMDAMQQYLSVPFDNVTPL